MHICCIHLHIPFPIKAIWEKGSGHSPLEGITTPFPARIILCLGQLSLIDGSWERSARWSSPTRIELNCWIIAPWWCGKPPCPPHCNWCQNLCREPLQTFKTLSLCSWFSILQYSVQWSLESLVSFGSQSLFFNSGSSWVLSGYLLPWPGKSL